jgi:hypothetical protein
VRPHRPWKQPGCDGEVFVVRPRQRFTLRVRS